MNEWISVKEKMPIPYHFVLIYCQTNTEEPSSYSLARWEDDSWGIIGNRESVWSDIYWGIDSDQEITHWMELPSPPKKK